MQFIYRFYGLLLHLFPRAYREKYGDELQTVFDLSLDDAMKKGLLEAANVAFLELVSLPTAILYEHLRERSRAEMTGKFASHFDFTPGSRNEALAALAPFALFGALPTLLSFIGKAVETPMWMQIVFVLFFWFAALGLFVIGFAKGAPRWFMPYLGLPLPIISLMVFNGWLDEWHGFRWYAWSWFLREFVFQGLLWVGLIGSFVLLILAVRLIPKLGLFYKRLRDDWTLMNFLLYGSVPFALVITFDDYINEEPYLILAFLILALGGWLYLRNDVPLNKFLFLYLGVALSMLTAAAGKAILFSSPSWPWPRHDFTWQSEAMGTIVMWLWLALIMLIPPLIRLLSRPDDSPQTA